MLEEHLIWTKNIKDPGISYNFPEGKRWCHSSRNLNLKLHSSARRYLIQLWKFEYNFTVTWPCLELCNVLNGWYPEEFYTVMGELEKPFISLSLVYGKQIVKWWYLWLGTIKRVLLPKFLIYHINMKCSLQTDTCNWI